MSTVSVLFGKKREATRASTPARFLANCVGVRVLREPLLHFVLLGALVFALHRWSAGDPANRITVSAQAVHSLHAEQQAKLGREPNDAELNAAIDRYVDSEVLYREAIGLGLDREDTIIRRRL